MTKYKRVDTKNNRVMYFADGHMIGKGEIPLEVVGRLGPNMTIESDTPPNQDHFETPEVHDVKVCIVCGEPAIRQKFLKGDLYGLCKEDYLFKTTGQIAEAINKYESENRPPSA